MNFRCSQIGDAGKQVAHSEICFERVLSNNIKINITFSRVMRRSWNLRGDVFLNCLKQSGPEEKQEINVRFFLEMHQLNSAYYK